MQHQPMLMTAQRLLVPMEPRNRVSLAGSRQTQPLMQSRHKQLKSPTGSRQSSRRK